jgi:hypothetical protein
MRNRTIIAFGIVLFLVLAGTGTATALWSSLSGVGGTVSAASMGITQSGFESLGGEYNATNTQKVAAVTVTNTGTIAATATLVMRGPSTSSNAIANAAIVQVRPVDSAAQCTPIAATGSVRWPTIPTYTNALEPGASVIYCVQSTLTVTKATVGVSMDATLALTSKTTVGNWSANAKGAATLTSRDTAPPSTPELKASGTTATSTTLTWADSTDNVGVTGYDLYRNDTMVASGFGNTWTDTSLVRSTSYTYKLTVRDAAGNSSSGSVAVKTLWSFDADVYYTVRASQATGQCIDASGESTQDDTPLILWPCSGGDNQAWKFVKVGSDTYKISAKHATNSGWSLARSGWNNTSYSDNVTLRTYSNSANNLWRIEAVGTSGTLFTFKNTATGECLDLARGTTTNNTVLQQASCNTSTTANRQAFTLVADK